MHGTVSTIPRKVIELIPTGNIIIIANIIIIFITDTLIERCFPPITFHNTMALYYLLDIMIMDCNLLLTVRPIDHFPSFNLTFVFN
jgi:hypothetical protein